MSETRVWASTRSAVTRYRPVYGDQKTGCGGSKRLYVGRKGAYLYTSYLDFDVDWSGIGNLVSAVLTYYTDDGGGLMPLPATTDTPKIVLADANDAFTAGNNADGVFDSSDYTYSAPVAANKKTLLPGKASGTANTVDITALVKARWMPSTVIGGKGTEAQAAARVFGLCLRPTTATDPTSAGWSGWSFKATDASKRPFITVTFGLGATQPYAPSSASPSGDVASITAFEADFSDVRATDTLARTEIEVYDATGTTLLFSQAKNASDTEITNARSYVVPDGIHLTPRHGLPVASPAAGSGGAVVPLDGQGHLQCDEHRPGRAERGQPRQWLGGLRYHGRHRLPYRDVQRP